MARTYQAQGRTVTTAATTNHCVAQLWNPSSTVRLDVYEIWICCNAAPAASAAIYLRRSTARGTAGSTATPNIENDTDNTVAPLSGALLDLAAFTGQPTFVTAPGLGAWTFAAVAASGIIMPFPRGITIPAGEGLCIVTTQAVAIPASDVTFVWSE